MHHRSFMQPPNERIARVVTELDADEIENFRDRVESANPPDQREINRFLLRCVARDAALNTALHELMNQVVKGIADIREDVKMMKRVAYGISIGAVVLWWLFTNTNVRPREYVTIPAEGAPTFQKGDH